MAAGTMVTTLTFFPKFWLFIPSLGENVTSLGNFYKEL